MERLNELYEKVDDIFKQIEKLFGEYPSDIEDAYRILDEDDSEESYEMEEELKELEEEIEEIREEGYIDEDYIDDYE